MQCKKCGEDFSKRIVVDGKVKRLHNRKFCLKCSPFGAHNTKDLIKNDSDANSRPCKLCGKLIVRKDRLRSTCWCCSNRLSRESKIGKIQHLVGRKCWICDYDVCWQAMDFHHVDSEAKLFPLTTRELQFGWDKIEIELRKCALLCCRCHREFHAGKISDQFMIDLWTKKWDNAQFENLDEEGKRGDL